MFSIFGRKQHRQAYGFVFNISEAILNATEATGNCIKRRKNPNTSAGPQGIFQPVMHVCDKDWADFRMCIVSIQWTRLLSIEIKLYLKQIGMCGVKTELVEK